MIYFKQTHEDLSQWYSEFKTKLAVEDVSCSQDLINDVRIKPLQISTQSVLFMAIDQCIAAQLELPPEVVEAKESFDLYTHDLHPETGKYHKTKTALQKLLTNTN